MLPPKLNTVIRLNDGRVGTICYHSLDGTGGVWGVHKFEMPKGGFGDLPEPDFLDREPAFRDLAVRNGHKPTIEMLGTCPDFDVVSAAQIERRTG